MDRGLLYFALCEGLVVAGAAIGLHLGRLPVARRGRRLELALGAALLALLFYAASVRWPQLLVWQAAWPDYAYVHLGWYGFPALLILGVGAGAVPRPGDRRALRGLAAVVLLAITYNMGGMVFRPAIPATETVSEGITIQSTSWSCGPAAAASMLRMLDVPATEAELARLTLATRTGGVTFPGLVRGLAAKLGPRAGGVRAARVTEEGLRALPTPFLVSLGLTALIDHIVVVVAVDAEGVSVGDPLVGRTRLTWETFRERWRGVAVWVEAPR